MGAYALSVVLGVIDSLSAYAKQSTPVTGAHPGDFIFL
jgi:hypothetical protein